jgi:hypothetical protein
VIEELRELAYEIRTKSGKLPLVDWIMTIGECDQRVNAMGKVKVDILENGSEQTETEGLVDPEMRRL